MAGRHAGGVRRVGPAFRGATNALYWGWVRQISMTLGPRGRRSTHRIDDDLNMENKESGSNWDELARELGAEVPAADEQQPAAAKPAAAPPPPKPAKPLPAPPKRKESGWDSLASDLGLAPPQPAPLVARETQPEKPAASEASPPPAPAEPTPPASPRRRSRPARPSKPVAPPREPEPPVEEEVAAAAPPVTPPPRPVAPSPPPQPAEPVAAKEKPPQSGSISLWHRIFGSPEEQAEKIADVSRAAEQTSTGAPAADDVETETDERSTTAARQPADREENAAVARADEDQVAEESEDGADDDAEVRPKKRRPRRRRRGRGRKGEDRKEDRPVEAAAAAPERDVSAEADVDAADEDGFDEIDAELDDEGDEAPATAAKSPTGKTKAAGHRSIPSWEETIGIMVDVNMQSRSQRKSSSSSSRGRSRGGRRRRKQ